jgi:hypothetical protein
MWVLMMMMMMIWFVLTLVLVLVLLLAWLFCCCGDCEAVRGGRDCLPGRLQKALCGGG